MADPTLPAAASSRGPDGLTDAQRRAQAEAAGVSFAEYQPTQEELDAQKRARSEGNNPAVRGIAQDAPSKEKLDPTLTDLLVRDLASGQVRRSRAGSRRATFGGGKNPYDDPTLGG